MNHPTPSFPTRNHAPRRGRSPLLAPMAVALILGTALVPAQVPAGTILQSLDNSQGAGVTAIGLTGNPGLGTVDIIAWGAGEGPNRARCLFNYETLAMMLGDPGSNGVADDITDIDALEVDPFPSGGQPDPFALRFSVGASIIGSAFNPGDIIHFTATGAAATVIPRSAFQAAIGTTQALDIDAYAELADGTVVVSFAGSGNGNNIISPLSGAPGTASFSGADTFLIRQPYGVQPAIFAWRGTELQAMVSTVFSGYQLTDVVALEDQPFTGGAANPWDVGGLYAGGSRPHVLFTVGLDENIICTDPTANPQGLSHLWAIVEGANGAGYLTNTGTGQVAADALALGNVILNSESRITIDTNALWLFGGNSLTLTVRSPAPAGTVFQLAVATATEPGMGLPVANPGYPRVNISTADPLVWLSLSPALAPLFMTAPADSLGSAALAPLPMPYVFGTTFVFQAFQLGGSFPLSAPIQVLVL